MNTTHVHTQTDVHVPAMLKTDYTFITDTEDFTTRRWLKIDHYDNCYANDKDEYEEHLGSINSLGKGGGVLLHVNYLTPCDLYSVELQRLHHGTPPS